MGTLDTAERNVQKQWAKCQNDCDAVVKAVKQDGAQTLHEARKQLIKDVLAPWHKSLGVRNRNAGNEAAVNSLSKVGSDWTKFAEQVSQRAKGEWPTKAEDEIKADATKAENIVPTAQPTSLTN